MDYQSKGKQQIDNITAKSSPLSLTQSAAPWSVIATTISKAANSATVERVLHSDKPVEISCQFKEHKHMMKK
ncbi:hypothetical protein [Chroococcidiopsis sp. CCMEE 29]|uniref:hypothetical protein n=1 Tax=Chroococcidiopsis sp. CCMEE 29 TaxID=155894 RepID=UPI002021B92F|nr:hypothetical protein [Chroococcidiopsis sp. CCMEE 29]